MTDAVTIYMTMKRLVATRNMKNKFESHGHNVCVVYPSRHEPKCWIIRASMSWIIKPHHKQSAMEAPRSTPRKTCSARTSAAEGSDFWGRSFDTNVIFANRFQKTFLQDSEIHSHHVARSCISKSQRNILFQGAPSVEQALSAALLHMGSWQRNERLPHIDLQRMVFGWDISPNKQSIYIPI